MMKSWLQKFDACLRLVEYVHQVILSALSFMCFACWVSWTTQLPIAATLSHCLFSASLTIWHDSHVFLHHGICNGGPQLPAFRRACLWSCCATSPGKLQQYQQAESQPYVERCRDMACRTCQYQAHQILPNSQHPAETDLNKIWYTWYESGSMTMQSLGDSWPKFCCEFFGRWNPNNAWSPSK